MPRQPTKRAQDRFWLGQRGYTGGARALMKPLIPHTTAPTVISEHSCRFAQYMAQRFCAKRTQRGPSPRCSPTSSQGTTGGLVVAQLAQLRTMLWSCSSRLTPTSDLRLDAVAPECDSMGFAQTLAMAISVWWVQPQDESQLLVTSHG